MSNLSASFHDIGRILVGLRILGDLYRVDRFVKRERAFLVGIQIDRLQLAFGNVIFVLAARKQVVFCIDRADFSERVFANDVFHHHDITRLAHAKVGLSGDDQAKSLKIGSDSGFEIATRSSRPLRQDWRAGRRA